MPELPEVEASRLAIERYLLGKTISSVIAADDEKVIEGIGHKELEQALKGRTLKSAHRKGKHLWLDLDSGPSLMFHFGE
jgi:formamidopyrimidine-DNA glycosylase